MKQQIAQEDFCLKVQCRKVWGGIDEWLMLGTEEHSGNSLELWPAGLSWNVWICLLPQANEPAP